MGAPAGTTQTSALPLVFVPARVWMRLGSIPLLAVRYVFTFSARFIASFAPALLSESGIPITTAVESACCCIRSATPSRIALALLSTRALPLANWTSLLFAAAGAAAPATFTVVCAVELKLRSSVAVATTVTCPASAEPVSSKAVLSRGFRRPLLLENESEICLLSGLATSHVMVELSPLRTLVGDAEHERVGGFIGGGGGGGGSSGPSIISTWSPTFTSIIDVVNMMVALCGATFSTTPSARVCRGSSPSRLFGKVCAFFCVSSVALAL